MLQGYPTKNGTGISIFGDYGDLNSLYQTVHQVASSLSEHQKYQKGQHQLLMNFAYEIRKAYSGQRLKEEVQFIGDDIKLMHYGFQIVWTDILFFMSALRYNAGFGRTDKRDQASLYLLEYVVEQALFSYDPQGAQAVKDHVIDRINVLSEFVFIIYQAIHIDFVSMKPGKLRFRKIPALFNGYLSESQPAYQQLISSFRKSALQEGCDISDLEFSDFPEFTW